jgi:hypothetical protein
MSLFNPWTTGRKKYKNRQRSKNSEERRERSYTGRIKNGTCVVQARVCEWKEQSSKILLTFPWDLLWAAACIIDVWEIDMKETKSIHNYWDKKSRSLAGPPGHYHKLPDFWVTCMSVIVLQEKTYYSKLTIRRWGVIKHANCTAAIELGAHQNKTTKLCQTLCYGRLHLAR